MVLVLRQSTDSRVDNRGILATTVAIQRRTSSGIDVDSGHFATRKCLGQVQSLPSKWHKQCLSHCRRLHCQHCTEPATLDPFLKLATLSRLWLLLLLSRRTSKAYKSFVCVRTLAHLKRHARPTDANTPAKQKELTSGRKKLET
jgi:hypothetical protein